MTRGTKSSNVAFVVYNLDHKRSFNFRTPAMVGVFCICPNERVHQKKTDLLSKMITVGIQKLSMKLFIINIRKYN